MNWQHVTREINETYREVPCRPISASTLTGIPKRKGLEGNCVLQILLWLGRTPESFVHGHPSATAAVAALPVVGPALILRWNPPSLFTAVDDLREERGLSWPTVATDVGVSAATLKGLAHARHVSFPGVMRIVGWVGQPAANFTVALPF
jgi:hypothetical protein